MRNNGFTDWGRLQEQKLQEASTLTIQKDRSVFFIRVDGETVGTCTTMRGGRVLMYADDRDSVDAPDFTLKNVKDGGIYELLLKYFPELPLGMDLKYVGF